jgi:huntingtin
MWSMAFYIMENTNDGEVVEQLDEAATARKKDWCTNMLNLAISEASKVSTNEISHGIYLVILTGLERLVIEQIPDEATYNKLMKMTTDLLTEPNPVIFVPAVQLFLACMYSKKMNATEASLGQDPEQLMQAMEQMSILFDCVRRSGVAEAKLLCDILPRVLVDFFSASDVMNRVINEFISPGQPHQVLLAGVLFAVFQQAAGQDQMVMMQQWVLSSLPNFTKRSPVSHSMWCLTVFFFSAAADNCHLQALFPYLQQRFGCYTHEDKRLFCLAARHFYHSLGEDKTSKDHFLQTIKNVAQPRTPYFDLLKSIE